MRAEVTYQARRLDSHPSLAIWGGGNEVEASFRWFPDSRDDPQSFTDDYMQVCLRHICCSITNFNMFATLFSMPTKVSFPPNSSGSGMVHDNFGTMALCAVNVCCIMSVLQAILILFAICQAKSGFHNVRKAITVI